VLAFRLARAAHSSRCGMLQVVSGIALIYGTPADQGARSPVARNAKVPPNHGHSLSF